MLRVLIESVNRELYYNRSEHVKTVVTLLSVLQHGPAIGLMDLGPWFTVTL